MAEIHGRQVCDRCRLVHDDGIDREPFADGEWVEDDRQYGVLCSWCEDVVEGRRAETREWLEREIAAA